MIKHGLAIHCHHTVLVEYSWDSDVRVAAIKEKPIAEIEIRLRLFKVLPKEACADLPPDLGNVSADCAKAYTAWPQIERDAFHAKWCGCSEWNGKEILFNEQLSKK